MFNHRSKVVSLYGTIGSSNNLQFKAERIKIPSTPRYPRSIMGSDRGENSALPSLPHLSLSPWWNVWAQPKLPHHLSLSKHWLSSALGLVIGGQHLNSRPCEVAAAWGCVSGSCLPLGLGCWRTEMKGCGPHYPTPLLAGSLSHSECSTPPQSPLNIDTFSSCSQSQTSASTLPRIAVNPVALGERRKDR